MAPSKLKTYVGTLALILGATYSGGLTYEAAAADDFLVPEAFAAAHKLVKPSEGEVLHHQLDWASGVAEARRKAAAEGKLICLFRTANGDVRGLC